MFASNHSIVFYSIQEEYCMKNFMKELTKSMAQYVAYMDRVGR